MRADSPALLLISHSTNPGEGYLDHCAETMSTHFAGCTRIAFVPYALADLDAYAKQSEARFDRMGVALQSVHRDSDPAAAMAQCDGVFVGGGNTFRLLQRARSLGLVEAIVGMVRSGVPYAGASAGSNLACPTIKTTNDMPIVDPAGLEALDLFPYQVNAHYVDRDPDVAHGGETREQRIAEFHEENETPVIGIREGTMLDHRPGRTTVLGPLRARLFRKGEATIELDSGSVVEDFVGFA